MKAYKSLLGAVCLLAPLALLLPRAASAAGSFRTLVTFSFDDSLDSQLEAVRILNAHDLRATFFVNSNRVGTPGSLTWEQLRELSDAGHEIGGHTLDHVRLTEESPDEARRQICDDRAALLAQGFRPLSFSYPYAGGDPETARMVASCGYRFGRFEGGIRGLNESEGRPLAETIPPANPLLLRTRPGVTDSWSLKDLQAYVERAELEGGGWVNFTFHNILETCGSKNYCTSPSVLAEFAAWVSARTDRGTEVVTVAEAFEGSIVDVKRPWVSLRSPAFDDPAATGEVLLEADAIDDVGVVQVYFLVGMRIVARVDEGPWRATWDSRSVSDGLHEVRAIAIDGTGKMAVSYGRTVQVVNGRAAAWGPRFVLPWR